MSALVAYIAGYPVTVERKARDRFAVAYGGQRSDNLSYREAANEVGACVMHALECADYAHGPADSFLAYCGARLEKATDAKEREFWQRLAGSVRKALTM